MHSGEQFLITYVFDCYSGTGEHVLTGELKQHLTPYVSQDITISNGAITITNDGTNIKLMNSKSTESVTQQATFTFFVDFGGGTES